MVRLDPDIELVTDLHISRVRQVTKPELPTTGHLISHTKDELFERFESTDRSNVLLLDDTSFSGTTTMLIERTLRETLGDVGSCTHGFLILNSGDLGGTPGAKAAIEATQSRAVGGFEMKTPREDGWHFFDIVNQANIDEHLLALRGLLHAAGNADFESRATQILQDEDTIETLFPHRISADELNDLEKRGRFMARGAISGTFHSMNPQLLPSIIQQGHIKPPSQWKFGEIETLASLVKLHKLIARGDDDEKV